MATSDNVLRCGLTSKHVDTEELLRVVRFASLPLRILRPAEGGGEKVYPAPVDDFRLSRIRPTGGPAVLLDGSAPQILVCTRGRARLGGPQGPLSLRPGCSAFVPAGEEVTVGGEGEVFRATVGQAREQHGRVATAP
ncbi:mannose-6-phosphate isomerase class I [Streptomyces sp. B1I3]|nr:mannose-6-phosphate isomerase class I [Streptomyces sp. B1I3]